jgi:carbon monoxide dehydrogenase subunit G
MAFRIEETFEVAAPVAAVWRYLTDPRQVVDCLPGAQLTEARDDRTFLGAVKVKVGPVVASYAGTAHFAEVSEADHRVRITAEGKERTGAGSAKLTLSASVAELPAADGASRSQVHVDATIDLAGKIVQFGRGMIETVNRQLFAQFTACVREQLESPHAGTPHVAPGVAPGVAPSAAPATPPSPPPAAPADATRVAATPPRTQKEAQPVRLLPLLWHAIRESFARLFTRIARP